MDQEASRMAIRALNHWRPVYMPTYVGLRLFLQQLPPSKTADFLDRFLLRKLPTRQLPRYRKFSQFKALDASGVIEYREFFAASPSTALGEAYALEGLATIQSLANQACVYSYRWPKRHAAGRSYQYFLPGYQERDQQVTRLLRTNPRYVVLVHDIHRFYPSVEKDVLRKRLSKHLDQFQDKTRRDFIRTMCEQVLSISETGIPIGPALGHVFGNVAMERVDARMQQLIGSRYLRYVDDLFLIVIPDEIKAIESELEAILRSEGLKLHDGKRDKVTGDHWLNTAAKASMGNLTRGFDDFLRRIQLFLWLYPKRLSALQQVFAEAGLSMPLRRFALLAQDGRWQRLMRAGGPFLRGWQALLRLRNEDERTLLTAALQLRTALQEQVKQLNSQALPPYGMVRRRQVQQWRYVLNRLLYLVPVADYQSLLALTPHINEFYDYRQVLQALCDKTLDPILPLPGVAVSTFAALWREQEAQEPVRYDAQQLDATTFDSVCLLSTFGVMQPPPSWIDTLSAADAELIRFSLFATPPSRTLRDHSFEDELRTLQLHEPVSAKDDILHTRFSDAESLNLEALLLAGYSYD